MNAIRTVVKMYARGKLIWFFSPWIGLLLQFLVALIVILIITLLFGGKTPFYPGGLITICVIMVIMGIVSLTRYLPFCPRLWLRRTDYVLGTAVMAVEVSAVTAVLWLLCSLLELVTGGWGIELYYFHLPYFNDGSLIEQFWVYFVILANMYFLGFVIGSISQRFGRVGTVIFVLTVLLLMSLFRWSGRICAGGERSLPGSASIQRLSWPCVLLPVTALYLLASICSCVEQLLDVFLRRDLFSWDCYSETFQNLLDFPLTNIIAICYILYSK